MKKLVILGVMVLLLSACHKNTHVKYEYYDFNGNYGISESCKIGNDDLICKRENDYIKVSQYSEINEK